MLSETIVQKMKQTNISVDAEKTKQRVSEVWKGSSAEDKVAITTLADVVRATIARVYKTGNISAKLAISISQILNIDPFYLTGESDQRGEYTEETLNAFMNKNEYAELLAEQKRLDKKTARKSKANAETVKDAVADVEQAPDTNPKEALEQAAIECKCAATDASPDVCVPHEVLDGLTEDDMILLMRAFMLRARAGGKHAEAADKLKLLLLS